MNPDERRVRLSSALALVLEMERSSLLYEPYNAQAAREVYEALKLASGPSFDHMEATIQRLHGTVSTQAGLAMATGYFLVGLLVTSPLWWGGGR